MRCGVTRAGRAPLPEKNAACSCRAKRAALFPVSHESTSTTEIARQMRSHGWVGIMLKHADCMARHEAWEHLKNLALLAV